MAQLRYYPTKKIHDLREMLNDSASLYRNGTAFLQKVDGHWRTYSFVRFRNEVYALGTALAARGFLNSRVVILGENCYDWCLSYMTAVCGLGVAVPLDKELPVEEVANTVAISEARLVLYSAKYASRLSSLPSTVERICFDELPDLVAEGVDLLSDGNRSYTGRSLNIDEMSVLLFTSGTTGVSKGVMLSHRNICHTLRNLCRMVRITQEDRALSVLPLHHVYECTCGFLYPLFCGASVAFSEGIRYIMKNAKEVNPTKILCVPLLIETMYTRIWANIRKKGIEDKVRSVIRLTDSLPTHKARMSAKRRAFREIHESFGGKLDLLVSGGAPIDPSVIRGLREFGITVIQGYGLTEASPLAAVNHDSFYNDRAAGLVLPEGELKIVNRAEDGTGEICYRGDNVMLGYFGRPDLTEEVKKNGWLYTGDLGYVDKKGFLIITGRKKNVIIRANGKNVFPEELETYLCREPLIGEAVVIPMMNRRRDEYDIVALLRPDLQRAEELLGKDYTAHRLEAELSAAVARLNETIQSYKRIDVWLLFDREFPKSSSGKVKRFELPEQIRSQYLKKR